MHTPASEPTQQQGPGGVGVGGAAKQVADHAKTLVGLEVELAKVELSRKIANFGAGAAMLVVALVAALYGIGFGLATVAAALDSFMPKWLSLLAVGLFLLAVAGVLALMGLRRLRRGSPPTPEQAIHEAKLTTAALKGNGRGGA